MEATAVVFKDVRVPFLTLAVVACNPAWLISRSIICPLTLLGFRMKQMTGVSPLLVRKEARISLTRRPANRQQASLLTRSPRLEIQ
jgi:hypothetical protein